jgi:hypothetical protein
MNMIKGAALYIGGQAVIDAIVKLKAHNDEVPFCLSLANYWKEIALASFAICGLLLVVARS